MPGRVAGSSSVLRTKTTENSSPKACIRSSTWSFRPRRKEIRRSDGAIRSIESAERRCSTAPCGSPTKLALAKRRSRFRSVNGRQEGLPPARLNFPLRNKKTNRKRSRARQAQPGLLNLTRLSPEVGGEKVRQYCSCWSSATKSRVSPKGARFDSPGGVSPGLTHPTRLRQPNRDEIP